MTDTDVLSSDEFYHELCIAQRHSVTKCLSVIKKRDAAIEARYLETAFGQAKVIAQLQAEIEGIQALANAHEKMNTVSTEVKSLKEIIADKVRSQFVDLIPQDQWGEMVSKEIDAFMDKPLKEMIEAELRKIAEVEIKKALQADYQQQWKNGQYFASELVQKIVKEHASQIIANAFSGAVQDAVQRTMNNLRY